MRQLFLALIIIVHCSLLWAQSMESDSHKHRMIKYVNKAKFEKATKELPFVEDWTFDKKDKKDSLNIDRALDYGKYLSSSQIEKASQDSFLMYLAKECEAYAIAAYYRDDYALSTQYLQHSCDIKKQVLGEYDADYALILFSLGSVYLDMRDYQKAEACFLQNLEIEKVIYGENDSTYASALNDMGTLYLKMKNYAKAEEYYMRALTIRRNVLDENHKHIISSLDHLGLLYYRMGDYTKAISYYIQSADVIKVVYGENSEEYADELNMIGVQYFSSEIYDEAEQYYMQSADIYKHIRGENDVNYICALGNIAQVYNRRGEYAKAEQMFLNTLEHLTPITKENGHVYMSCINGLGNLYVNIGDYNNAEQCFIKAIDAAKTILGENHPNYVGFTSNLSRVYRLMGQFSKAESKMLQALQLASTIYGENHSDYALFLGEYGLLSLNMGDYSKAETNFRKALDIFRNALGEKSPSYALTLNSLGLVLWKKEDPVVARMYFSQAAEIQKEIFGENNAGYAEYVNNIGAMYEMQGDYEEAKKYYQQALNIRKIALGEENVGCAYLLHNMGSIHEHIEDYSMAEKYYIDAIRLCENAQGYDSQYTIYLADLCGLYEKQRKFDIAEPYIMRVDSIDKNRYTQSLDFMTEKQRELYWNTINDRFIKTYPDYTYRYYLQHPSISSFGYDNELFTKGLLLNSTNAINLSIQSSGDSLLIDNFNRLKTLKARIVALQEKNPQSPSIAFYQNQADSLEKEITKSSAAYRENQAMWQITWDSVRNNLNNSQVSIEYMVAPLNEDSTMYCALLLRDTCSRPIMIPLFNEPEVASLINTNTDFRTNFTYSMNGRGDELSQLVWGKVLPYIKKGETIYFAPSGLLHQLAIESMPYDSTHTMSDVYNMVRLSSTREIVFTTATLYGGIQYNVDAEELLAESEAYSAKNLLASRGIEADTLNRGSVNYLAGTKTEVENINRMLRTNHLQVQLFTATNANEESFKSLSGTHQNILHIATHGFFWSDSTAQKKDFFAERMTRLGDDKPTGPIIDPLNRCGLLFAGANLALQGHSNELPEGVQDGILTAKEISLLDLRDADLVVLSACETGKGEISGDGVFGLQRAFKMAGVQTVIMSLWPVNDAATQMLMTEFYRNWIMDHQAKREAFRNAQNAVRAKYKEPAYWAGFVMLD